ncbi:ribonuclease E/G [Rhodobacter capsulatus]|uniref:Ribonuclease, Rne/Rng family n=1 Tax=Rhodobacter capsulatus TaxID=1061 RepID=A0A0Q0VG43_RHOCA|nr:ribonuclease E/G [Rhodobacter capsulatus]KQB12454.1 ribonuclease G [Rhodobacter capsulatus]KQB15972.1 ribonuclease G [Rhodobacter capsulatus]PZX26578.1 Rne/Rng family ribonuclease [Rhodobacter capsulatus]QNR62054.1 ribonuclease E/G [Rhodobacter capsulatus]WER10537.1 ribonuclease E/G [Rhodobacter capsulatus]
MKGRIVVLGAVGGLEAAALMVDGQLEDLLVDVSDAMALAPGAICRAKIERPMKGQGGLFVALPGAEKGFLKDAKGLSPGQSVLVQVSGGAEPGKAIPVTLRLLFKGRYGIVTPGAPGLNVSRRIREEDTREGLQALAAVVMEGSEMGLILRSACEGAEEGEIVEDLAGLRELAEAVLADVEGAPELLVDAPAPHEEAWREWADPAPDEVVEGFEDHGVLEAIDAVLSPRVALPGGGHLMIEPTRALVAVDVNTGADTSPAAALKANIAAARDLPRQLRLRGLGGQVVVDFAPMPKKDRLVLEQQLRAAFKTEAAETSLAGWTPLGLYELVRKRDRAALASLLAGRT